MSIASFEQALRKDLPHHWAQTEAEVTDCTFVRQKYEFDAAGMDTDLAHYVVAFTYKVGGTTYSGVLSSPVEVERGDTFSLRYNPADPKENNSLESELDRPWFKEYTWLVGGLIVAAMLADLVHRYLPHLFRR